MLDPLGQAWQNGSSLATQTPGRVTVNTHRLCGRLLYEVVRYVGALLEDDRVIQGDVLIEESTTLNQEARYFISAYEILSRGYQS